MLLGADEGYDPISTWSEEEEINIQLAPTDGHTYVRLEEDTNDFSPTRRITKGTRPGGEMAGRNVITLFKSWPKSTD